MTRKIFLAAAAALPLALSGAASAQTVMYPAFTSPFMGNVFQLGGTTSSFPGLKALGNSLRCRLADDSGDCGWTSFYILADGGVTNGVIGWSGSTVMAAPADGQWKCTNTAKTAACSIIGTTTNDNAVAGAIGEYGSSTIASGSAVAMTNGTPLNITSVSLAAGDYDVEGNVAFTGGAGVTATLVAGAVSLNSASFTGASLGSEGVVQVNNPLTGANAMGAATGPRRISLSATTTVYLVATGNFSGGTLSAYGTLRWRRVR